MKPGCLSMSKLEVFKWIGTISSIIGSFAVAFQIYILGYALFILGSIVWATIGLITKDKALVILNGFFLCANIIGVAKSI